MAIKALRAAPSPGMDNARTIPETRHVLGLLAVACTLLGLSMLTGSDLAAVAGWIAAAGTVLLMRRMPDRGGRPIWRR